MTLRRNRSSKIPSGMGLVHRSSLKPERTMTDEELLADALREAEEWNKKKNRTRDN